MKRRDSIPRRLLLGTSAALLAAAQLTVAMTTANAAPGDPFDPSAPTVFIAQNSPSQLQRAETTGDGSFEFSDEGPPATVAYNAIGFNPADNFIYGIVPSAGGSYPAGSLVRIGQDGAVTRVGNQTYSHPATGSTRFYAGAFNPADGYFYVSDSGPNTTVLVLNATDGSIVRTVDLGQHPGVQDFAFKDGFAWGATATGEVHRLDMTNGTVTVFPDALPAGPGGYGAVWNFGNGNLGFSANTSGDVTQLRITNGGTAAPEFEVVSTVRGPDSSLNDGTSIPGLPADLSVQKSAPATFLSGERLTYSITVTNNGPGISSGWTVTDQIPTGLSDPQVSGDGNVVIDGNRVTLSGGRLAVGGSATFTISAIGDIPPGECVTNTAVVEGNEADETPGNDQSSAQSCAELVPALTVTKTSDATAGSRPGDVVTYTITATNTGTGDYTAAEPAVIFDDLTAVLDDADYLDDASADRPGTVDFARPLLSWSGPLAVDETVEISYSVRLKGGGDGNVRNVAWRPEDPGDPAPPACDPANEEGLDPETNEPCAATEFELPKLTIDKTADRTDLPRVGEQVTYTVTVTNVGPGDYTAGAPARMTDDLSDVLDDATVIPGSVEATVGSASVSGNELSWSGVLAAGDSAVITYTVAYTGAGDQQLVNLACVPEADTASGTSPCDRVTVPGSGLSQWKTVTASDDPAVAGTTLTYTLHFENDGQAPAEVSSVDFLTHLLDDADITAEPRSDVLTAVRSGERIEVTGTLAAGQSTTVTYTVTVKPDGERGDDIAANFLVDAPAGPPPAPPATPECLPVDAAFADCTSTPIGAVVYSKSVTASSDPVTAGTVLTYTVKVESTGTATVPVAREDVLTDVLDDADLESQPESDTDSVTVSEVRDARFSIGGKLAGGKVATITYQVRVKEGADRGNGSANNFLVNPGDQPPGECPPGSTECTVTPLPDLQVSKSVDPKSGTTVAAGDELVYTLRFENTGQAPAPVDYVDHLSGVLDDASLVGTVTTTGDLQVTGPRDERLLIEGAVAPGEVATVVYTVKVKESGDRGDHHLGNFLTLSGDEPPNRCLDANPLCTENPVKQPPAPAGDLPSTGARASTLSALITALLLGAGGATLLVARRSRKEGDAADG